MGSFGKPWPAAALDKAKRPLINRKIRNATKCQHPDGTRFDSKLEMYFYSQLKMLSVPVELQEKIILIPKYRDKVSGAAVRAWTWTVDFYFPWCELILDTKGFITDRADLAMKVTRYKMHRGTLPYKKLIIVKNKDECRARALEMKARHQEYLNNDKPSF